MGKQQLTVRIGGVRQLPHQEFVRNYGGRWLVPRVLQTYSRCHITDGAKRTSLQWRSACLGRSAAAQCRSLRGFPRAINQDVRRFHIAMYDAASCIKSRASAMGRSRFNISAGLCSPRSAKSGLNLIRFRTAFLATTHCTMRRVSVRIYVVHRRDYRDACRQRKRQGHWNSYRWGLSLSSKSLLALAILR